MVRTELSCIYGNHYSHKTKFRIELKLNKISISQFHLVYFKFLVATCD